MKIRKYNGKPYPVCTITKNKYKNMFFYTYPV